jgi:hypothetical protein
LSCRQAFLICRAVSTSVSAPLRCSDRRVSVLPMATAILPWLTPLAAIGLAINVLMATGFHVREDERLKAILTTLWATIAGIIGIGRWNLIDQAALAISPRALVAALAVLLPAAITIVIIVYTRPARATGPR